MYLISTIHWIVFSTWGEIGWVSFDWIGAYPTFETLKISLEKNLIPYHATAYSKLVDTTLSINEIEKNLPYGLRYFSNGFSFVSPHIIFLKFINTDTFIRLSFIIYNSLGFYGLYKFYNEFNLSKFSFVYIFILISFNGYVVSRMGIGHLLYCNAYMYISLYLWIIYKFIIDEKICKIEKQNTCFFRIIYFLFKIKFEWTKCLSISSCFIYFMLFLSQKNNLVYWISISFIFLCFYIIPTYLFGNYITNKEKYLEVMDLLVKDLKTNTRY